MAKKMKEDQLEQLLDQIDFKSLSTEQITGPDGLIKQFTKRLLETAMNAEVEEHLGYEKHERTKSTKENYRNGTSRKKVHTDNGDVCIDIPRDRNGDYEPIILPKHARRFRGFDEKILSLYSFGMTNRDIQRHLYDIYEIEVSAELISNVTNAVIEDAKEWRNRNLDELYPVVFFDAIVVKGRTDGKVVNKAVYIAIGINMDGHKEVLGLWIGDTEGSKFWLSIITELKNRGVNDILIACIDGLKGFPEAINAVYPKTEIQLCIVHMIRNSARFVSWKDRKKLCSDLRRVYSAPTEKSGLEALEEFNQKWGSKFPMIYRSWKENWQNLNTFFDYPKDIRKAIYTTNAIESLNSSLKKVIKKRSAFPTDEAIYKVLFLALRNAEEKWTMPIREWGAAINQFAIHFEGRVKL